MKQNRITNVENIGVSPHSSKPLVMGSTGTLKVLNLYAGIGGNRRLWSNVEVTAVEYNASIAAIYKDLYPNDNVVVGDAHEYLLKHFYEFDFIWASPPCPTHSKMETLNYNSREGYNLRYPDMKLYQEIIILQNIFKGKFCVENVKGYYEPLIKPQECGRHYFWTNFKIGKIDISGTPVKGKKGLTADVRMKKQGYDITNWHGFDGDKRVIFKNCVESELGLYILNCAKNIITSQNKKQVSLFE